MSITIRDVAKAAGVSCATTSRALNMRPSVSPETRRRVKKAAHTLGYNVNIIARGLVSKRTASLGLIAPAALNPFFTQMMSVISVEAKKHGYALLLALADPYAAEDTEQLRMLYARRVDGILFITDFITANPRYLRRLQKEHFPIVALGQPENIKMAYVSADENNGCFQLTRHLLSLGHRRIGILGDFRHSVHSDRVVGYRRALEAAGIPYDASIVKFGVSNLHDTHQLLHALLDVSPQPTAIIGYNDHIAIAVLHALRDFGIQVPSDIAVAGFDDIELSSFVSPALTTMTYPWKEIATQAITMLISLIDSAHDKSPLIKNTLPGVKKNRDILLPYSLTIRESCGATRPIPQCP